MNAETEIARAAIHNLVDAQCERALAEISLMVSVAKQQINAKFKHENRSAGQRRRWANERSC